MWKVENGVTEKELKVGQQRQEGSTSQAREKKDTTVGTKEECHHISQSLFWKLPPLPQHQSTQKGTWEVTFFSFLDKQKKRLMLSSFLLLFIIYSHKYKPSLLLLGLNTSLQIWKICVINVGH